MAYAMLPSKSNVKQTQVSLSYRGTYIPRVTPHFQGTVLQVKKAVSMVPPGPGGAMCQLLAQPRSGLPSGWLKRLKAESAEEGGPEGAQVEVPVMLVRFTDVGGHLPIRIVQASLEGATAAEFQDEAIPWHKLHHRLLTKQLEGKHSVRS